MHSLSGFGLECTYTIENDRKTDSFCALVVAVPCQHWTTPIDGTEGNFEYQHWHGYEQESPKVGNKELQAVIIVDDRGEAQQVSQSDGTAHGAENELDAVSEHIAAIFTLLRLRRERRQDLSSYVHVGV